MELLASCSLERSKSFNGRLSVTDESGKDIRVSLNVIVDGISEDKVFDGLGSGVKCVTFVGDTKATKCPKGMEGRVFNQYTLEELNTIETEPIEGVVVLVRLSDDYCDMRSLVCLCEERDDVRVIGGKLLNIEGVRIGRFDSSKPMVCSGVYDTFIEADIDDLEGIKEKIKKAKVAEVKEKRTREKKEKVPAEKKVSKKVVAFKNMFGSSSEDF